MNWQPIETYDALKIKPKFAVFYVARSDAGRLKLAARVEGTRTFGMRNVTHWMPLPDAPTGEQRP
jgi:hypothetical protein